MTSASAPGVQSVKEAPDQGAAARRLSTGARGAGEFVGLAGGRVLVSPGGAEELPAISFGVQNVMLELMRVMDERRGKGSST